MCRLPDGTITGSGFNVHVSINAIQRWWVRITRDPSYRHSLLRFFSGNDACLRMRFMKHIGGPVFRTREYLAFLAESSELADNGDPELYTVSITARTTTQHSLRHGGSQDEDLLLLRNVTEGFTNR